MWLARDADGFIHLFYEKPVKSSSGIKRWRVPYKGAPDRHRVFYRDTDIAGGMHYADQIELNPNLFIEVQWENSPVELKMSLK